MTKRTLTTIIITLCVLFASYSSVFAGEMQQQEPAIYAGTCPSSQQFSAYIYDSAETEKIAKEMAVISDDHKRYRCYDKAEIAVMHFALDHGYPYFNESDLKAAAAVIGVNEDIAVSSSDMYYNLKAAYYKVSKLNVQDLYMIESSDDFYTEAICRVLGTKPVYDED